MTSNPCYLEIPKVVHFWSQNASVPWARCRLTPQWALVVILRHQLRSHTFFSHSCDCSVACTTPDVRLVGKTHTIGNIAFLHSSVHAFSQTEGWAADQLSTSPPLSVLSSLSKPLGLINWTKKPLGSTGDHAKWCLLSSWQESTTCNGWTSDIRKLWAVGDIGRRYRAVVVLAL